jgi:hypothetical protein
MLRGQANQKRSGQTQDRCTIAVDSRWASYIKTAETIANMHNTAGIKTQTITQDNTLVQSRVKGFSFTNDLAKQTENYSKLWVED